MWCMRRFLTNMGLHGGDMLKPTHLSSNMLTLETAERHATRKAKARFDARMERKRAKAIAAGKKPKVFHLKCKNGGFQGGPDLSSSAVYPHGFVTATFKSWQQQTKTL